jgi:hypothetical protein
MATKKIKRAALPAPRMQLRWARSTNSEYQWQCHYELVLPLGVHDVRREADEGKQITELVVPMKEPTMRNSSATPCTALSGERHCDAPFRDGAHAQWDAKLLGGLPVYVIAPDSTSFLDNRGM